MVRSKKDIAEEWKRLTFSRVPGVSSRSRKELEAVLKFEERQKTQKTKKTQKKKKLKK